MTMKLHRMAVGLLWLGRAALPLAQPSPFVAPPAGAEAPISLNVQNIELRTLMQVFADFTGLNVVTTDAVTGSVSVRLKDVPWPQALQIVLQSKGLASRQEGRVIWVAPQDEWLQREKKHMEAQTALERSAPCRCCRCACSTPGPPRSHSDCRVGAVPQGPHRAVDVGSVPVARCWPSLAPTSFLCPMCPRVWPSCSR